MTTTMTWSRDPFRRYLGTAIAAAALTFFACSTALAQRGRGGGGGGGGHPGGGGGAHGGAPHAGGGGGARLAAPQGHVGGGARVAAPQGHIGGGARVAAPGINSSGGASVNAPAARAAARAPAVSGGAAASAPNLRTGNLNTARGSVTVPQVGANGTINGGAHTALRPNLDANTQGAARLNADGAARATVHNNTRAATSFRPNWYNNNANLGAFRTTFGNAMNSRYAANRAARAAYWNNWAGNVRNGFYMGSNPYFGNNFWSGRNLIGFGLGGYGLGGYGLGGYGLGGYGLGGYGLGGYGGYGGLGNWWGYSPWLGNQPWSYWYGNPGWNTFANNYGWSTPYYYDYGPQGNIVYSGDQVLVNGQTVGTPEDYAQSAADLATVTEEQMNAPHDWMPLGTFSVATSQNESNPARVAQLAYDNKQGLLSGTIFNRESNNVYTLQGKVDPQSQRVAFTVGKDPNVVMETGLYNLTQNETPVLVHFGPEKTATYLFVRLPEPETEQGTATASAPAGPTAPPADDLRR